MRILWFLFSGVVAVASPLLVTFGDSVTAPREGIAVYTELLEEELRFEGQPVRMVNRGVGGNTTTMAMARFEQDVISANPDMVVIMFGINDSAVDVWKSPPAAKSRVSLTDYRRNLTTMIRTLKDRDVRVVLMTSNPKHWSEKTKQMYGHPPYDPESVDGFNPMLRKYVAEARDVAREERIGLVDIFAAFEAHDANSGQEAGSLTPDGVHPGNDGQRLIADQLITHLIATDVRFTQSKNAASSLNTL